MASSIEKVAAAVLTLMYSHKRHKDNGLPMRDMRFCSQDFFVGVELPPDPVIVVFEEILSTEQEICRTRNSCLNHRDLVRQHMEKWGEDATKPNHPMRKWLTIFQEREQKAKCDHDKAWEKLLRLKAQLKELEDESHRNQHIARLREPFKDLCDWINSVLEQHPILTCTSGCQLVLDDHFPDEAEELLKIPALQVLQDFKVLHDIRLSLWVEGYFSDFLLLEKASLHDLFALYLMSFNKNRKKNLLEALKPFACAINAQGHRHFSRANMPTYDRMFLRLRNEGQFDVDYLIGPILD